MIKLFKIGMISIMFLRVFLQVMRSQKIHRLTYPILKVALSMEYFLPLLVVAGVLVEIIILVSSQLVAVLIFFLRNHQPYLSMLMR